MRFLGALLVLSGCAGTAWAALATSHRRRPIDLLAALAAPVAFALAVLGGVLLFVPDFLR
jgi:hypothetical protein